MSQFVDLARNLLTLEVNTVLKSGMSAEKMPLAGDALIDIAQDYYLFLCEQVGVFGDRDKRRLYPWAVELSESFQWGLAPLAAEGAVEKPDRYSRAFLAQDLPGNDAARGTTVQTFAAIREVASWLRQMQDLTRGAALEPGADPAILSAAALIQPEDFPVLMRIQRNSDQINDILRRRGLDHITYLRHMDDEVRRMPDLKTADIVIVRKAWDMGTEVIVMQSTIQIDGDVVTRILRGRDTPSNDTLIGVHKNAVDVSFRYWSFMVDALGRFAGKAVNRLVGDTG